MALENIGARTRFSRNSVIALPRLTLGVFGTGKFCIAMILGVTGLFRTHLSAPGRWLARLAPQVYGVYLVHFYIVIEVQRAILPWDGPALAKFAVATGVTLLISFPLVAALRRLPGLGRVL